MRTPVRLLVLLVALGSALAFVPSPAVRAEAGCTVVVSDLPATPIGVTRCSGVRPGAFVQTQTGGCTLNFLWVGGDGRRYIGTAGHCIGDDPYGQRAFGSDGVAAYVDGVRIGQAAYGFWGDDHDFALIRLDDGVAASAAMMHFGGPTGVYTEHSPSPVVLYHYGHGLGTGLVTKPRSAVALNTLSHSRVVSNSTGTFGDSGSGVIDRAGRAVGVLVTLGLQGAQGAVGVNGIKRFDFEVPFAEQAMGTNLVLQTAPLETLV